MIVVDDRLLFEILSGTETTELATPRRYRHRDHVLLVLPTLTSTLDRTVSTAPSPENSQR